MNGPNESHVRALVATFKSIDAIPEDMESAARGARSPFARTVPDVSARKRAVLTASASRIRGQKSDALRTLGAALPPPDVPAAASTKAGLSFAEIAPQEIPPSRRPGCGPLRGPAGATVARLEKDLQESLRRLRESRTRGNG
jgi:hypothetical protein